MMDGKWNLPSSSPSFWMIVLIDSTITTTLTVPILQRDADEWYHRQLTGLHAQETCQRELPISRAHDSIETRVP